MEITRVVFVLKPFKEKAGIDRDIARDSRMLFSPISNLQSQFSNYEMVAQ
jgi:hypothetical protein